MPLEDTISEKAYAPRDEHLWNLTRAAVVYGKSVIEDLRAQQAYIGEYFNFPRLGSLSNGLPSVHRSPFSGKTDYTEAFLLKKSGKDPRPTFEEMKPFRDVVEYVLGNGPLRTYFSPPIPGSLDREMLVLGVGFFIAGILNRNIYLHGLEGEVNRATLLPIYLEMETPIFQNELLVDFLVPIVSH